MESLQELRGESYNFKKIQTTGQKVPKLHGHSMNFLPSEQDQGLILLFGGKKQSWQCSNSVYLYDISSSKWLEILKIDKKLPIPSPRECHRSLLYKKNQVLVHGGVSGTGKYLDDLWMIEVAENRNSVNFNEIICQGPKPFPRRAHSFIYVQKLIVLYGGQHNDTKLDDLWTINIESAKPTWSCVTYSKNNSGDLWPQPLSYQSTSIYQKDEQSEEIYLFGGWDKSLKATSNIYSLKLTSNNNWEWKKIKQQNNIQSLQRGGHHSFFWQNFLIVLGGKDEKSWRETNIFDINKNMWYQLEYEDISFFAACVVGDHIFVHGGLMSSTGAFRDSHLYAINMPNLINSNFRVLNSMNQDHNLQQNEKNHQFRQDNVHMKIYIFQLQWLLFLNNLYNLTYE